jgi:SpoIID/LytB domain protein
VNVVEEPAIRVGVVRGTPSIKLTLAGGYVTPDATPVPDGHYTALAEAGAVLLGGPVTIHSAAVRVLPVNRATARVTIDEVTIGIDFHWQQKETQSFEGSIEITAGANGLQLVNILPLESYLTGVISSEMSASCPAELLGAHAIVSRSWLLAQLAGAAPSIEKAPGQPGGERDALAGAGAAREMIRWYGRESHPDFDVCADDHCQRYQGIGKAFSPAASDAVAATRGIALVFDGEICDTRYSKCCGGFTEDFGTAWEDKEVPYLASVYDGPGETGAARPISNCDAGAFIHSRPDAYCNTESRSLLARILTGFDQETADFFRWQVEYTAEELSDIVESRLGLGLGRISRLEPWARGPSARIHRLRIRGENGDVVIGKELEIRRALSRSHLYSSAFTVQTVRGAGADLRFRLTGAGWGHGVGLCQIGAAVMADSGMSHRQILTHYFPGTLLQPLY